MAAAASASADDAARDYDDAFMLAALAEARIALAASEVPVGCVFVDPRSRVIVARGHNMTNARRNALEHAELVAIEALVASRGGATAAGDVWGAVRGLDLYVTVEPCIMCAAALLYHGIGRVFFGCRNPRFGGNGTILSVHQDSGCCGGSGDVGASAAAAPGRVGYPSFAGFRQEEAVRLLQDFYEQENPSAPQPRPKRRRRADADGDASGARSARDASDGDDA